MTADKPEASKCACTFEGYVAGNGCAWHRGADKPEARRTCAVWCGTGHAPDGAQYWSPERWCGWRCRRAGRPLNPAPRPVEDPGEQLRPVAEKFAQRNRDIEDGKWPRPVERCPCEESVALRKALEGLIADIRVARAWANSPSSEDPCPPLASFEFDDLDYIERIARRALALGEEDDNG